MGLKDEILDRLAAADCKEKVAETISNHKNDIVSGLHLDKKDSGMLDAVQEKIISRKLLVFGVATALLWYAGLDAETWGMIAMTYIGGQTAIDFAKVWRGA